MKTTLTAVMIAAALTGTAFAAEGPYNWVRVGGQLHLMSSREQVNYYQGVKAASEASNKAAALGLTPMELNTYEAAEAIGLEYKGSRAGLSGRLTEKALLKRAGKVYKNWDRHVEGSSMIRDEKTWTAGFVHGYYFGDATPQGQAH